MADTNIEWTDVVWNATRGCSRVSPGCGGGTPGGGGGCYAERMAIRLSGPGQAYEGLVESTTAGPRWTGKLALAWDKLLEPLHWRRSRRVFVNSMSDLFHENLEDKEIDRVFATMLACHVLEGVPSHSFQVLSKRAERMADYFAAGEDALLTRWANAGDGRIIMDDADIYFSEYVENRKHGLPRLEHLRRVPAALRFLSVEPLLEDLGDFDLSGIGWAIIGGESGPGARPFDIAWARSIIHQCRGTGTRVFMKQVGAQPMENGKHYRLNLGGDFLAKLTSKKGGDPSEWPEDIRIREFPEVRHA